jgi:hypothetical protein
MKGSNGVVGSHTQNRNTPTLHYSAPLPARRRRSQIGLVRLIVSPCRRGLLVLDFSIHVRVAHRAFGHGAAPKPVLAGLMALLLLVASVLSVSHSLHQSLHRDGSVNGHLCLVCSFAKGHASGPAATVALAAVVLPVLFCLCLFPSSLLPRGFDYRIAHGRAPPLH